MPCLITSLETEVQPDIKINLNDAYKPVKLSGITQVPNCEYEIDYTLTIEQDLDGSFKDFSELVEGSLPDPNIFTIFSKPTLTVYWYTKEELYKFSKFNSNSIQMERPVATAGK